jgi:hypothetical protein
MIQDVKKYIEPYVSLSIPIPYENLLLYPIKVSQYFEFVNSINILLIEKNKIADIKIIQMSYLKFIATLLSSNDENSNFYNCAFFTLMSLVFNTDVEKIAIEEKDKQCVLKINDVLLSAKQFDDVKKIILFQNLIDYDDTPMSDDYKKVIEDYYALKNKGIVAPSFEQKINVVISNTAYTEDSIKDMTYRRFCGLFNIIVEKTEYIVGCNGYTRKEPPEHWIYKSHKDKYSEVFGSDKFNELQK